MPKPNFVRNVFAKLKTENLKNYIQKINPTDLSWNFRYHGARTPSRLRQFWPIMPSSGITFFPKHAALVPFEPKFRIFLKQVWFVKSLAPNSARIILSNFQEMHPKMEIMHFRWKWFRMQEKKVNWLNSKWVEPLAFKYW